MRWMVILLLALASPFGCDESATKAARSGAADRVVSFSPAITATLVELGLGGRVRGRTPWCRGVGDAPVVGSLEEVDLEQIAAIDPDLVLVQRTSRGVPEELQWIADRRGWRVETVPGDSLEDMRSMGATLARLCDLHGGDAGLAARWERLLARPPGVRADEKVVFLMPGDPPRAFGGGSYLADLWQAWGGKAWPDARGWPEIQLEDLIAAHPERVFVVGGEASPALAQALAGAGMKVASLPDAGFLQPGPEFLRAAEAWRTELERRP